MSDLTRAEVSIIRKQASDSPDVLLEDPEANIAATIGCCQWVPFTWQGEGAHVGKQVSMFRFIKCNLACPWCDADPLMKQGSRGVEFSLASLIQSVNRSRTFMITGGEPLTVAMNRKWAMWLTFVLANTQRIFPIEILDKLGVNPADNIGELDFETIIETNGLKPTDDLADQLAKWVEALYPRTISVAWSPKFLDYMSDELKSKAPMGMAELFDAIARDYENFRYDVKLVGPLGKWEKRFLGNYMKQPWATDPRGNVYIMPLGETQSQLRKTTKTCLNQAERYGVRFGARVHITHGFP